MPYSADNLFNSSLFFFIPAILNIGIAIYAFLNLPANKTNFALVFFFLLLGIANGLDGLFHASISYENAKMWAKLSVTPWTLLLDFQLLFLLRFADWERRINQSVLILFLFLPAILFEFLIVSNSYQFNIVQSEYWNWSIHPSNTWATTLIYIWNTTLSLLCLLVISFYSYFIRKDLIKRKPAFMLLIGLTIPMVLGIFSNVVLPLAFNYHEFPLAPTFIGFFSIFSLITILKYKKLSFSPKAQWQKVLDMISDAVIIVDNQNIIKYVNPAFAKLTQYEPDELINKIKLASVLNDDIINVGHKNDYSNHETKILAKNGTPLFIMYNSCDFYNEWGEKSGLIFTLSNISQLKNAQKDLEIFSYKLSHDLRSPVSSIISLVNIIKNENDVNKLNELLEMINLSAKKMDEIILSLTNYLQIQNSGVMKESVDIYNLINQSILTLSNNPGREQLKIIVNIIPQTTILTNQIILSSAIQNLIENAIKYLDINKTRPELIISTSQNEKYTQLIFQDNGIGINSDSIKHIFELFYRASSQSKGSGMGLFLVKAGIEKLGGTIEVESIEGKGTKFIINIPIA